MLNEVTQFASAMDALYQRNVVAIDAIELKLSSGPVLTLPAEDVAELDRVRAQQEGQTTALEQLGVPNP